MEDKSIIKPVLDALEYFKTSEVEIKYFYNVIDKFCSCWFGKKMDLNHLSNQELLLIHELLGEYIRFEKNNKRVALWLLAINRVCYNFEADLSLVKEELEAMNINNGQDVDTSLIEPILEHLKIYDQFQDHTGQEDDTVPEIFSTYLQWVMVYTTIIYPALDNKLDFKEKATLKAMNFIMVEFIKQRSNDKRLAFLLMGIIEACRLYSLQHEEVSPELLDTYKYTDDEVLPGHDEEIVMQILNQLKDENDKQREKNIVSDTTSAESYLDESLEKLLKELNSNIKLSGHTLNKAITKFNNKFLQFDKDEKIIFLKKISHTTFNKELHFSPAVYNHLLKSVNALSDKIKQWLDAEVKKNISNIDYQINLVTKIYNKPEESRTQFSKPYIMMYILKSFELFMK